MGGRATSLNAWPPTDSNFVVHSHEHDVWELTYKRIICRISIVSQLPLSIHFTGASRLASAVSFSGTKDVSSVWITARAEMLIRTRNQTGTAHTVSCLSNMKHYAYIMMLFFNIN